MNSIQTQVSDGTLSTISVGLEFISQADIYVYLSTGPDALVDGLNYQWTNSTTIQMLAPSVVPVGVTVTLYRRTYDDAAFNIFDGNAPFTRMALDENFKQVIFLSQESVDRVDNLTTYIDEQNEAQDVRIDALSAGLPSTNMAFPWRQTVAQTTAVLTPGFTFATALLWIDGICQSYGESFLVSDNTIVLAEAVPPGTRVFAILGQSVMPGDEVAAGLAALPETVTLADDDFYPVLLDGVAYKTTQATLRTALVAGITSIPGSAAKLTTPRTIAASGDATWSVSFDGSANVTAALTLATVATAGTYPKVTVDTKGRVTSGTTLVAADIPDLDAAKITSGTLSVPTSANAGTATKLATARTISLTGDATGTSAAFDGSANVSCAVALSTTGVAAGSYKKVTVDTKGRVSAGVAPLYFSATKDGSTAQSIPSGADTKILLQTLDVDSGSGFTSSRFTATIAGVYRFGFQAGIVSAAAADTIQAKLFKNGARHTSGNMAQAASFPTGLNSGSTALVNMAVGDYVELYAFCQNTSNANVNAGNCFLSGELIS